MHIVFLEATRYVPQCFELPVRNFFLCCACVFVGFLHLCNTNTNTSPVVFSYPIICLFGVSIRLFLHCSCIVVVLHLDCNVIRIVVVLVATMGMIKQQQQQQCHKDNHSSKNNSNMLKQEELQYYQR